MQRLARFFRDNPRGAIAFSGGTDSSLLVCAAARYGADWRAYYVSSVFQPAFEREDAERVARQCGMPLAVIEADVLSCPEVAANPADRCYHCKKQIFSTILKEAERDGRFLVIDGTNASDDAKDRPGMRALRELGVRSPLRECGITKAALRQLSRAAGLPTWNKPAYACLATRIPAGTRITPEDLARVDRGEAILRALGYSDLRLRLRGEDALLQLPEEQHVRAKSELAQIRAALAADFRAVTLDPYPRPSSTV